MAISKTIEFNGVTISECYIRVAFVKGKKKLDVGVDLCANEKSQPFSTMMISFEPAMDGQNFIQQAYDYLKTLTDFSGAVDC